MTDDAAPSERTKRAEGSRRILGLDEAGRGSVLGPLVLGGLVVEERRLSELRPLGVKDSKQLTPKRRTELYTALAEVGERTSLLLSPREIDPWVRRGGLNRLEARGFAELVRRTRPDAVFVDACDPVAARFGRDVARLSGVKAEVTAQHHADVEVPVVGGASIVAKVERDAALGTLSRELDHDLGSGYPSDARTLAALEWGFGREAHPPWVRLSWSTAQRVKPRPWVERLEAYAP
ncbi:MAG: ribonuclease HII [Thermoplasmata archaeon]|nr:ribonuclease HII [Thermoplasmata archaeon]